MPISYNDYISYINTNCQGNLCCTDPDCQQWITDYHKLTSTVMNAMVYDCFECVPTPDFITISVADLQLDKAECSDLVLLNYDPNLPDNNDISVSVGKAEATTTFSVALFKGVVAIYGATEFVFSKAKDALGNATIVFKGKSATGTDVYMGDLAQDEP